MVIVLGSILSQFKRGGGGNWLFKNSYRFSFITRQRKRIDLFWHEHIYFFAYINKPVIQLCDFLILIELISKQCSQNNVIQLFPTLHSDFHKISISVFQKSRTVLTNPERTNLFLIEQIYFLSDKRISKRV